MGSSGIGVCSGSLYGMTRYQIVITENLPLQLDAIASRLSAIHKLAQTLGRKITFKVYMDSAIVSSAAVRSQLSYAGLELVDCPHDKMKEVVDKAITGM